MADARRTIAVILLISLCLPITTGCWDRVEIDQRGFVVGIAIDIPPQKEAEDESKKGTMKYRATYQIIKPSGLASSVGGKGGGGPQEAYTNVSTEENSMPVITSKIASMVGRSPYFEHLQIIILSAEVARRSNAMRDIFDYFLRDVEMRRDIKVLITPDKAEEILNVGPVNEKYPVAYLESISENDKNTSFMIPATRIGDLHEYLLKLDGFTVQSARYHKRKASLNGAAVFEGNSNKLLGFLTGPETQGLNLLRGQVEGGILQTPFDEGTIDIELEQVQHAVQADIRSPRDMTFTITVTIEGMLEKSLGDRPVDKETETVEMQQRLEAEVQKKCRMVIDKLQRKMKEDAIGLSAWLKRNRYPVWKQIEGDWNESIFPNVEIEVAAQVEIRRVGNIIMTDEN